VLSAPCFRFVNPEPGKKCCVGSQDRIRGFLIKGIEIFLAVAKIPPSHHLNNVRFLMSEKIVVTSAVLNDV
jgi:hypothetical protein